MPNVFIRVAKSFKSGKIYLQIVIKTQFAEVIKLCDLTDFCKLTNRVPSEFYDAFKAEPGTIIDIA